MSLTTDQRDAFSDALKIGGYETAAELIPEDAFEPGLSVFEMSEDGLPVVDSVALAISLSHRIGEPVYEVSGVEVGRGHDGEPLVTVETVESHQIADNDLVQVAIRFLQTVFRTAVFDPANAGEKRMCSFYSRRKINIRTGETAEEFDFSKIGPDWILGPYIRTYTIAGWTFSGPTENAPKKEHEHFSK